MTTPLSHAPAHHPAGDRAGACGVAGAEVATGDAPGRRSRSRRGRRRGSVQIVSASWWVATVGVARAAAAAAYVITSREARRRQRADHAAVRRPGRPRGSRAGPAAARRPRGGRRGPPPPASAAARADLGESACRAPSRRCRGRRRPDAVDEHEVQHDVERRCRPPRRPAACGCPAARAARRWRRASAAAARRRAGRSAGRSSRQVGDLLARAEEPDQRTGERHRRRPRGEHADQRRPARARRCPGRARRGASPAPTWRATEAVVP